MQGSYKPEQADFQDFPELFLSIFQDYSRTISRTLNMGNYHKDAYGIIKTPRITTSALYYILNNKKDVNQTIFYSTKSHRV